LVLELERDHAERLRDCLTQQPAKIGFEKDYALTKSGETLEGLIDKFYVANPQSTETDEGRI